MHTYRFSYLSKIFLLTALIALLLPAGTSCADNNTVYAGKGEVYVVLPGNYDSANDLKWSKYLYNHMKRRGGGDEAPVFYDIEMNNSHIVTVHLDSNAKDDFIINNDKNTLHITAKSERTMLWLLHQYMRKIGDIDKRFPRNDLASCIISFNDTTGKFPFTYRDVYSPTNLNSDLRGILGLNNIDTDWGLWGHNISLTLPESHNHDIYAQYDGTRTKSQYCFSSKHLYNYIKEYIREKCGNGEKTPYNFAILPNDNSIACECSHCRSIGNTPGNATPAITNMIRKLAKHYPYHTFFTSAYKTTHKPCSLELPSNAGVIVSAITWQPGMETNDEEVSDFKRTIKEWRSKTDNIYVWDYINNYDDYFTPLPILKSMQRRFKIYRDNNIKGIFLNGSGYDYSTFEELHTHLLAALMMNPDIEIENHIDDFFYRTYPITGAVIADYYHQLLKMKEENNKVIPLYGGIDEKKDVFLNTEQFINFYHTITKLKNRADEEEAYKLRKLITALSFTYLEIARSNGYGEHGFATLNEEKCPEPRSIIHELLEIFDNGYRAFNLTKINEAGNKSADYVESWKRDILGVDHTPNLLYNEALVVETPNNKQVHKGLTDGIPGLPVNYYYGWNIIPEKEVSIELPPSKARSIKLSFLTYPHHKIHYPSRIELWQEERLLKQSNIKAPQNDAPQLIVKEIMLDKETSDKKLTLKIHSSGHYHIAIDEIHLIP